MRHHAFVAAMGFVIAATLVPVQAQAASADPTGIWRKAKQGERPGKIQVFKCGRSNKLLCAKIIWLQNPLDSRGRPLHDVRNENPGMRDRPILGLPIISGMQPVAANQWKGSIYNPEDGNTYSATLTLVSRNQIHLKGCKAWLLCGERTWLRTSAPPKPEPEPEIEASAEPDADTAVASETTDEEQKPNVLSNAEVLEPAADHPVRPGYRFLNTSTAHNTPAGFNGENVDSMFVMTKPIASEATETSEGAESAETNPIAAAADAPQSAPEAAEAAPPPPAPAAQPKPKPQNMQANATPTPQTKPAPQATPSDPEQDAVASAETETAETDLVEEPPLTRRERRLLRRKQGQGLLPWLR